MKFSLTVIMVFRYSTPKRRLSPLSSPTAPPAEEIEEEVIYNKDITVGDEGELYPAEVNVKVTAFYVDPGSDDYVYVVSVDE